MFPGFYGRLLAPRGPQEASRRPQEVPRRPPGGPQEAPRGPQEAPKRLPRGPKRLPRSLKINISPGWEYVFHILPNGVQYVAVRPPPGPRSAGFNPAAAAGRYDRRLARSVRLR